MKRKREIDLVFFRQGRSQYGAREHDYNDKDVNWNGNMKKMKEDK